MVKFLAMVWLGLAALTAAAELVPRPQRLTELPGEPVVLRQMDGVVLQDVSPQWVEMAAREVELALGWQLQWDRPQGPVRVRLDEAMAPEAYRLKIAGGAVELTGGTAGIYHGWHTLVQLLRDAPYDFRDDSISLSGVEIDDFPSVARRGMICQWCYLVPEDDYLLATVEAMARLKYNIIMPEFGPHFPEQAYRKLLRHAKLYHLTVIPCVNSLAHGDRGWNWPVRLEDGLDLGAAENYRCLADGVEKFRQLFASEGIPLEYFNFGMDEASKCMLANQEKYGRPAGELYLEHLQKVLALCREKSLKPLIYHDMIIGREDAFFGGDQAYDAKTGIHRVRDRIPKEFSIIYWNYDHEEHYASAFGLAAEGFTVWQMSWGAESALDHARQAGQLADAVIGSCWMETAFFDREEPGGNSVVRTPWVQRTLAATAAACWNNADDLTSGDQSLVWNEAIWRRPAPKAGVFLSPDHCDMPAAARQLAGRICEQFGLPGENAVVLGAFAETADNLKQLRPPLTLRRDGRDLRRIDLIDQPAEDGKLCLFTRAFGPSTGTGPAGYELVVRHGVVSGKNYPGYGDAPIPAYGFVLSGSGAAGEVLAPIEPPAALTVRDADSRLLGAPESVAGPMTAVYPVHRLLDGVEVRHFTLRDRPLFREPMVTVALEYEDGSRAEFPLVYGCDVASWLDPVLFYRRRPGLQKFPACWQGRYGNSEVIYGWRQQNPHPERQVAAVSFRLADAAGDVGYVIQSLQIFPSGD